MHNLIIGKPQFRMKSFFLRYMYRACKIGLVFGHDNDERIYASCLRQWSRLVNCNKFERAVGKEFIEMSLLSVVPTHLAAFQSNVDQVLSIFGHMKRVVNGVESVVYIFLSAVSRAYGPVRKVEDSRL